MAHWREKFRIAKRQSKSRVRAKAGGVCRVYGGSEFGFCPKGHENALRCSESDAVRVIC